MAGPVPALTLTGRSGRVRPSLGANLWESVSICVTYRPSNPYRSRPLPYQGAYLQVMSSSTPRLNTVDAATKLLLQETFWMPGALKAALLSLTLPGSTESTQH